jgi:pimeloyl-ACP methyl ester carboxylesterase
MRTDLKLEAGVFLALLVTATIAAMSQTKSGPDLIESRFGEVDGIKIHYLTAGHGPAVILLHGYAETSRMWRPLIPKLTDKFTVVAPDLPGIGDSDIPKNDDGLDMKTAAIRIHALVKSLGISKARVVGHDIGLMVAYAYAAQFPSEVEKLVVMDAFLPGVPGWELAYDSPNFWHFRFHGSTPEALVQGREKIYFTISGTTWLQTELIRFQKRIARRMLLLTPVRGECERGGHTLLPGRIPQKTSRKWLRLG